MEDQVNKNRYLRVDVIVNNVFLESIVGIFLHIKQCENQRATFIL